MDAAENLCATLLRVEPGNHGASMMLADLMLQRWVDHGLLCVCPRLDLDL